MKSHWTAALALAAIWLVTPALAQTALPPAIGIVEYDRILTEYEPYQAAEQQYDQFRIGRQAVLDEAANTRLLADPEKQELENLKGVAAMTAQQKERIQELLGLTEARLKELRDLSLLAQRDEAQEARLKELSALLETRGKEIQTLKEGLDKEIADKADELMKPINEKIQAALGAVAKRMNLIAVLDKQSVLYGGKDVTDRVLAELKKS
jgi:Skp family chaperone for outer membrane proteins